MTRKEAIQVISNIIHDDISVYGHKDKPRNIALAMAIEALKERPRGEWEKLTIYESTCSCCKNVIDRQMFVKLPNFCPNCGADMRKERG